MFLEREGTCNCLQTLLQRCKIVNRLTGCSVLKLACSFLIPSFEYSILIGLKLNHSLFSLTDMRGWGNVIVFQAGTKGIAMLL